MPFVIRPASESTAAEDPRLVHTLIEPDHDERLTLRDLHDWGWRITQHKFGDDDYVAALKQIEKDVKRRRRQTHAIAGELHGYHERPSLEDIWKHEAERMLGGSAYLTHRHEIEKNWLRATDRTRQRNGFLDCTDLDGKRPRLVTRGLDHTATDNASLRPYEHYLKGTPCGHEHTFIDPALDPTYLFYLQDAQSARKRQESIGMKRSSSVGTCLRRPRSMLNIFPCKKGSDFNTTKPQPANMLRTSAFRMSSIHTDNKTRHDNHVHFNDQIPHLTTKPPYLDSTINLIFPGTLSSPRDYIRSTRPGIRRSSTPTRALAPPLNRAGLGVDPYGWLAWDEAKQRKEETRANYRFFLRRMRPSMDNKAMRRVQEWSSDVGPRDMKREAKEIFGRNG